MLVLQYSREETIQTFKKRSQDDIFLIENLLSDQKCDILRDYIDNNANIKEKEFNDETNVKSYVCKEPKLDISSSLYKEIVEPLMSELRYIFHHKYAIFFNEHEAITLRKIYGATSMHIDSVFQNKIHSSQQPVRILSCIICLNDDYEGGELIFPSQNRTIKLKKGQILLFPPYWTHPHYSEKLKNNTFRYTINTWLYD